MADVDKRVPILASTAKAIWDFSEVGYQETKSSALLQGELRNAGFVVKPGVAGMPTAFIAGFKIFQKVFGFSTFFERFCNRLRRYEKA